MAAYFPSRGDLLSVTGFKKNLDKLLVLTDKPYAKKVGLIICCGIVDQPRGSVTDVPIPSLGDAIVAPGLVFTLTLHQYPITKIGTVDEETIDKVLLRLIPLIGGEKYFDNE